MTVLKVQNWGKLVVLEPKTGSECYEFGLPVFDVFVTWKRGKQEDVHVDVS